MKKPDWVYRVTLRSETLSANPNYKYKYRQHYFFSVEDLNHYMKFTNEKIVEIASATVGDFFEIQIPEEVKD